MGGKRGERLISSVVTCLRSHICFRLTVSRALEWHLAVDKQTIVSPERECNDDGSQSADMTQPESGNETRKCKLPDSFPIWLQMAAHGGYLRDLTRSGVMWTGARTHLAELRNRPLFFDEEEPILACFRSLRSVMRSSLCWL